MLLVLTALMAVTLDLVRGADDAGGKSALETDAQGWQDIMPANGLAGWYRVAVPPTGKLGRDQWHADAASRTLICDGDGVGCDRSCFFFWRETWLKKVDGPAAEDTSNGKAVNVAYDIDVGALGKKPESPRPV